MTHAKPVLIFVPGLGSTGDSYRIFLGKLRQRYEVRVAMHPLDFPSQLTWPFFFHSIDQMADDLDEFTLVGHSMGGAIALAYAARHPRKVRRVVAIAPPVIPRTGFGARGLAQHLWYRRLLALSLALRSGRIGNLFDVLRDRGIVLGEGRRQRLYSWIRSVDLRQDLPKLRHATVLWARKEEVIPASHLTEVRSHENVTVKIIKGSHSNLAFYPKPVMADVLEAIDG